MIQLKGHSGCSVILLDQKVVRKTSPNESYNHRLQSQLLKQSGFTHQIVRAPEVIESGFTEDGRFFFDMRYIKGRSLASIFKSERLSTCIKMVDCLDEVHTVDGETDIRPSITAKLNLLNVPTETKELILGVDWRVKVGFCHGDMTFENVIVSEDGIYLIDFLDSFVDSPVIDRAKMLQDAFCYWSFDDGSYVPKRKLMSICERYGDSIHYRMLLIHLLRIVPYADASSAARLTWMINKTKDKINRL